MSTVTDPVMLDSTGQIIVSKLQDVIDAINGGTIDPLTVTQNGTYTPSGTTLGYGPVTVDVQGGGGGTFSEEWDFTSDTPLVGKKLGLVLSAIGITYSQDGAVFDSTSDYLRFGKIGDLSLVDLFHDYSISYSSITIEVKVISMSLVSGTHRRFIMGASSSGLIYRSTGVWAFYSSGWEDFNETDGSFFDGSIVKVVIDSGNKWHIYKDNVLLWEPTRSLAIGDGYIGSTSNSINNVAIEWLKIDAVTV